jgi:hypothetical protein
MKMKTLKRITSMQIDVSKWARGKITEDTLLRDDNGCQCCLGFHCKKAGLSNREILDVVEPGDLTVLVPLLSKRIDGAVGNTLFSQKAININDDDGITLAERMARLKKHYASKGIKVTFIRVPKDPENHR